jgi:uncharacterized UBP type Zn finger protein
MTPVVDSYNEDNEVHELFLPIDNADSVDKALQQYFLSSNDEYSCPTCKTSTRAVITSKYEVLPDNLLLRLLRDSNSLGQKNQVQLK